MNGSSIARWADHMRQLPAGAPRFVYFKHEEQGKGPEFAKTLQAALGV